MKPALNIDIQTLEFAAKKVRSVTHPARIQIIKLLEENDSMSVTQIYEKLNILQAETSHHLALLREYGVLKKVRTGKMSIYSLNKDVLEVILKAADELVKK
jgi:DNA-binding transcriptional ArsR family regulator